MFEKMKNLFPKRTALMEIPKENDLSELLAEIRKPENRKKLKGYEKAMKEQEKKFPFSCGM